jgi:F-type H+-transporting ATPase subunit gamma
MTSLKDLRSRIAGIRTNAKITQTMQMIASTELVKYKKLLPIALDRKKTLKSFLRNLDREELSQLSYLKGTNSVGKKNITIIFGSDRGLCGGFNSKIVKSLCAESDNNTQDTTIIAIGKKIPPRIKTQNVMSFSCTNGILYTFQLASHITNLLLELSNTYLLTCKLLYNGFNNALNYETITEPLLPFDEEISEKEAKHIENGMLEVDDQDFGLNLATQYIQSSIHHALLSSKASEESARVMAMDGATKNSNQLTEVLTLKMNKIRQSNITGELIEIVSSSQALK